MAVFLTASLLAVRFLLVVSDDLIISAKPGDTIFLPCKAPNSRPVVLVEWDRTDPESDHVLVFRDDQIDPELQHPSFKNRVDLQDRQMKDGDVSLVLRKVMTEDTGTYECRVDFSQSNRRKRAYLSTAPLSTIQLQVSPPTGPPDGQGLIVGLVVSAMILVLMIPAVIIIIVRRRLPLYHPPHSEAELGPP